MPFKTISAPWVTDAVAPLELSKTWVHGVKTTADVVVASVGALVHKYNL